MIIARELERNSDLIIAFQPTRGLDVGAIEYIHKQLLKERAAGKAILLVSYELSEIMQLSDRILVLHNGQKSGVVKPHETNETELGLLMTGVKKEGTKLDQSPAKAKHYLVPIISVFAGFLVGAIIMLIWSYNPITAYASMFTSALGNMNGLGETIREATPLIFTAIGFAIASKAGFLTLDCQGKLKQAGLLRSG